MTVYFNHGSHVVMPDIEYYFDDRDPSILPAVHGPTTTWKDVYGKIELIHSIPRAKIPVIHVIFHLQESGIIHDSMVGRFSTFATLFQNKRIGLRVFVYKGFEMNMILSLFLRTYPEFRTRLFVTPTADAAFTLIQREKANHSTS